MGSDTVSAGAIIPECIVIVYMYLFESICAAVLPERIALDPCNLFACVVPVHAHIHTHLLICGTFCLRLNTPRPPSSF